MRLRGPIVPLAVAAAALAVPAASRSDAPPPPVAGKTVNLAVKAGTVRFKVPGASRFVTLTAPRQVPLGTVIDTTAGRVTLTSAADLAGGTQHAWFYRGLFKVGQTAGDQPVTDLALAGPQPACGARAARTAAKQKPRTRRLWGEGKGSFRTSGRFSAATVRGTRWLVEDACRGTLTIVTNGVVSVRDFRRQKTILVRAGHRYLARR